MGPRRRAAPRLPRERTAQQEADRALVPKVAHVARLLGELAVPPHAVLGHVGAQVGARRRRARHRVARRRHIKQRACPRIV